MASEVELSDREIEILKLVATGVSNKEIAYQLGISPNTVKVHLRNVFTKIGASSRTEAAFTAVRMGLVEQLAPTIEPDDELEDQTGPESDGDSWLFAGFHTAYQSWRSPRFDVGAAGGCIGDSGSPGYGPG